MSISLINCIYKLVEGERYVKKKCYISTIDSFGALLPYGTSVKSSESAQR